MLLTTLSCPQCGAPLPRQARWRTVVCAACGSTLSPQVETVRAATFRAAYDRLHGALPAVQSIHCGGQRYRVLAPLGRGAKGRVVLAERIHPFPQRVVIHLADVAAPPAIHARTLDVLTQLQGERDIAASFFSLRLPEAVLSGMADDGGGVSRPALVLRHHPGYWGSLFDAMGNYPAGIDARHLVWIWRRVLELLVYLHPQGWSHNALLPQHLLLHPRDHGVRLLGWSAATRGRGTGASGRDLAQLAASIRAAAGEHTVLPAALAALLARCRDAAWCQQTGAYGIEQALLAAAQADFGAPRFIPFFPDPQHRPLNLPT